MTKAGEHSKLFWVIRGGGGGNFGIVTRFLFKIYTISPILSTFRFGWKNEVAKDVIVAWLKFQRQLNQNKRLDLGNSTIISTDNLTFFLRLTVAPNPTSSKDSKNPRAYPVYASGSFHGSKKDLQASMKLLSDQIIS